MKVFSMAATAALVVLAGTASAQQQAAPRPPAVNMVVTTTAFADGGKIKPPFACENAQNFSHHSPGLAWTGAPEGTVAFAVLLHDTDVHPRKAAYDVLHWLAWNIPGTATMLAEGLPTENQLPDGTRQAKNVTNTVGYMGPCPPPGKPHHYVLELYALDKSLEAAPESSRDDVVKAMDGHILASSVVVGQVSQ